MIVTLDFECAYGKHPITGETITLSKMTTEEYVRHKDFKVHGVGIKIDDGPVVYYYEHFKICAALAAIDWSKAALCAHHAHFDGAILNWIYGIVPKFWLDTLSMARARSPHTSASLDGVARRLGLGFKGRELVTVKDKWELTHSEQGTLGGYCINDVDLTYKILMALLPEFPQPELKIIDMTVRAFTEPILELDAALLSKYSEELRVEREIMDASLTLAHGVQRSDLRSNPKFAALLEKLDVDPPMKISPTTGKLTYAFAKADTGFMALQEHPDAKVRHLVEMRLGAKSSILETRTKRFLDISGRGELPVYITYYGAKNTGRFSGGDKINIQNLNRGSELRYSIKAPQGYKMVACDLSNIEARMLAWLANEQGLLDTYRAKGDPYCEFASWAFNKPVNKKEHPRLRAVGKVCILGLGYSMSWRKLAGVLLSGPLGEDPFKYTRGDTDELGLNPYYCGETIGELRHLIPSRLSDSDLMAQASMAKYLVDTYRANNKKIKSFWREGDRMLRWMLTGTRKQVGPLVIDHECIHFPNGLRLHYPDLQFEDGDWSYKGHRGVRTYLYGAKLIENIVQGISRVVMTEAMLVIAKRYRVVMTVHDEVVFLVPEDEAEEAVTWSEGVMRVSPSWAPDLPLDAEANFGDSYGECK